MLYQIKMPNTMQLSPSRVLALYENLHSLRQSDGDTPGLPEDQMIEWHLKQFQKAQATFIKEVNIYMRVDREIGKSEEVTIDTIIKAFPECLVSRDGNGKLPIDYVCNQPEEIGLVYVPKFLEAYPTMQLIAEKPHSALRKIIMNDYLDLLICCHSIAPECFVGENLTDCLSCAMTYDNLEIVKWFIDNFPNILMRKSGGQPIICFAKSVEMVKLILSTRLKQNPKDPFVGGLFEDKLTIDYLNHQLGDKENLFECVGQVLSQYRDVIFLHKVIEFTPHYILKFVTTSPHLCFLRDENERLPIHIALEKGIKWSTSLTFLINSNYHHLQEVDPVTKLYPAALAATKGDVETINHLLRLSRSKDISI